MRHGVNNLQDYRISSYVRTIVHTRYFTSDNEPEGIENATHNTLGKRTWIWTRRMSKFALEMYCGLHFKSVGLITTREIHCI
jgi:hypothetical protein